MTKPKDQLSLWFRGVASTPDWIIQSEHVGEVCRFAPTSTRTHDVFREYANLFLHSPELKDCLQSIVTRLKDTGAMPAAQMARLYWYAAQLSGVRDMALGVNSAHVRELVRTKDSEGESIDRPTLGAIELAITCKPNPLNRPASGIIELACVGPSNQVAWTISNAELGEICSFGMPEDKGEGEGETKAYARCFAASLGFRDGLRAIAAMARDTADMPESPQSRLDWYAKRLSELAATARDALALERDPSELDDDTQENPDAYQAPIMQRGN